MSDNLIFAVVAAGVALFILSKIAVVVPQQNAYVIERLGKFSRVLSAGFHILLPFIDRIAYRHSLKERAADITEQVCITKDNVQVGVDGVLYLQILDPRSASYGIGNYEFAISQLAQTTLRSEIGKIDLDRTFEERGTINSNVVAELDKASDPWGVKVLRYEIKNINPPRDVLSAMEKQMRAERDAQINTAEGEKQRVIKESEAVKEQQINEAQGEAEAILAVATATAEGLRRVAIALNTEGGDEAMQLKVAQQYIDQFGNLAKSGNTLVVPANLTDLSAMMTLATNIAKDKKLGGKPPVVPVS